VVYRGDNHRGEQEPILDRALFEAVQVKSLLNDLRDYNRDDCLSTLLLRDWLIERAKEAGRWPPTTKVTTETSVEESELEDDGQDEREERERARRQHSKSRSSLTQKHRTQRLGNLWPIWLASIAGKQNRPGGHSSIVKSGM
jgi:hypothetical protein